MKDDAYIDLKTATNETVRIYCFKRILAAYQEGKEHYDMIIMNNDLTTGIPEILQNSRIPIYPSMQAGWHARLKSHHFSHTANLIREFAGLLGLDPWLFSCLFEVVDGVNINVKADQDKLAEAATKLFKGNRGQIQRTQHSGKTLHRYEGRLGDLRDGCSAI